MTSSRTPRIANASNSPHTATRPSYTRQPDSEAGSAPGPTAAHEVVRLQRHIGNAGVQRLLGGQQSPVQRAPAIQRDAPSAAALAGAEGESTLEPGSAVQLDDELLSTYDTANLFYAVRLMALLNQKTEFAANQQTPPASLGTAIQQGQQRMAEIKHKPGEAMIADRDLEALADWFDVFAAAHKDAQERKAAIAAEQLAATKAQMQRMQDMLAKLEPDLRDAQRSAFRKGEDSALMGTADTLGTLLDCSLTTKDAILKLTEEISALRMWTIPAQPQAWHYDINTKATAVLEIAEKINKAYAAFQLVRDGLALMGGGKTASDQGSAAVKFMGTMVSAGGTLLGASAGLSLYANLYLGPGIEAALGQLDVLKDLISTRQNRPAIEMGEMDWVNWDLEPGGRAMYEYMAQVMKAGSYTQMPDMPAGVAEYFLDNKDDFEAGAVGDAELATEGWFWWKSLDTDAAKSWVWKHRNDVWGMLYGSMQTPRK